MSLTQKYQELRELIFKGMLVYELLYKIYSQHM